MANFNLEDVLDLERAAIRDLPPDVDLGVGYWKEPVARLLYCAWVEEPNDVRIWEYTFPMINSLMVQRLNAMKASAVEQGDAFNSIALLVYEDLKRYTPERGRLFSYLTMKIGFHVLDLLRRRGKTEIVPLDDWDSMVDDGAAHALADFRDFLIRLKGVQGPTSNRMLDALLAVIEDNQAKASLGRDQIIRLVCQITSLPEILVRPFYFKVIDRFQHSVLD